jgi:ABC-type nitrate/sulfonate/bicarbonate transport system ATPase subunit
MTLKTTNIALSSQSLGVKLINKDGSVKKILTDISLDIFKKESVSILGPSGCGKSTLAKALAGYIAHTGTVKLEEKVAKNRLQKVGMMFQDDVLLPWLTVKENLDLILIGQSNPISNKVAEILSKVGLNDSATKYPFELSEGMVKRVAVARELLRTVDVVILDEPFSALDPRLRKEMQKLTLEIARVTKKSLIFITHNNHEAIIVSNRIFLMSESGNIKRIFSICQGNRYY